ncbi:OLC1v1013828C1 [Oldenlandia corymbosa var. corymbosa]|uniref:OLC1v1013828C1 n=1 Tax=Oldenlandia corymbosa var. corymbosa TaxID=529605 RepID=A0AAV1DZF4_OLDCO|nr:OLC1v1013828C1 [Oldenlandia corymbosa var. corymbosa]
METELPMLKKFPSIRPRLDSGHSVISREDDSDIDQDLRYTSLKDLLLTSSPRLLGSTEGSTFDSSTISIRNELVKHAASAYIQSATISGSSRNQDYWLSELCDRLNSHSASRSCWHVYVRIPLRACFRPVFRFFDYVINGLGRSVCY